MKSSNNNLCEEIDNYISANNNVHSDADSDVHIDMDADTDAEEINFDLSDNSDSDDMLDYTSSIDINAENTDTSIHTELELINNELQPKKEELKGINKYNKPCDIKDEDNIITPIGREKYIEPLDCHSKYLSDIYIVTCTLSGKLSSGNILPTQVDRFKPTYNVFRIISNHGEVNYDNAPPVETPKKSSRGRKPKKKEHPRKKQGNGEHFASQITFHARGLTDKIYKVKIFSQLKIQIPGAIPKDYKDIDFICNNIIACIKEMLFEQLEHQKNINNQNANINGKDRVICNETAKDIENMHIKYLYRSMINVKFYVRLPMNVIINLQRLKHILSNQPKQLTENIKIRDIKFEPEDAKVAICTEWKNLETNETKGTKINIFYGSKIDYESMKDPITQKNVPIWGGKINTLGGINNEYTRQMYYFLDNIFSNHIDELTEDSSFQGYYMFEEPKNNLNEKIENIVDQNVIDNSTNNKYNDIFGHDR